MSAVFELQRLFELFGSSSTESLPVGETYVGFDSQLEQALCQSMGAGQASYRRPAA